jgi:hypothetical protein
VPPIALFSLRDVISVDPTTSLAVGNGGSAFVWNALTETWTSISTGCSALAVLRSIATEPLTRTRFIAVGDDCAIELTLTGATWSATSIGPPTGETGLLSVALVSSSVFFATGSLGVWR